MPMGRMRSVRPHPMPAPRFRSWQLAGAHGPQGGSPCNPGSQERTPTRGPAPLQQLQQTPPQEPPHNMQPQQHQGFPPQQPLQRSPVTEHVALFAPSVIPPSGAAPGNTANSASSQNRQHAQPSGDSPFKLWMRELWESVWYNYYNKRSPATDLHLFAFVYISLMLMLATIQHYMLDAPGVSYLADLYRVRTGILYPCSCRVGLRPCVNCMVVHAVAAEPAVCQSGTALRPASVCMLVCRFESMLG